MGVRFVIGSTAVYAFAKRVAGDDSGAARLGALLSGAFIGLLALVSASARPEEQGWALGIGSATVALAFFIAGLIANLLALIPLPAVLAGGGLLVMAAVLPLMGRRHLSRIEAGAR